MTNSSSDDELPSVFGRRVLTEAADALREISTRLDRSFDGAIACILECTGRVIVTGMGKSGHIGRKIASTLASTGTPAHFMHPAEAVHGDLGMITERDVALVIAIIAAARRLRAGKIASSSSVSPE